MHDNTNNPIDSSSWRPIMFPSTLRILISLLVRISSPLGKKGTALYVHLVFCYMSLVQISQNATALISYLVNLLGTREYSKDSDIFFNISLWLPTQNICFDRNKIRNIVLFKTM